MAKAIEQTPVLEDKEAVRFMSILSNVDNAKLTKGGREVKEMVKNLPRNLKL